MGAKSETQSRSEMEEMSPSFELTKVGDRAYELRFSGCMDHTCAGEMFMQITSEIKRLRPGKVRIDLRRVKELQDFGLAVILELRNLVGSWSGELEIAGASGAVEESLRILSVDDYEGLRRYAQKDRTGVITRFGEAFTGQMQQMGHLVSFAGAMVIGLFKSLFHPRSYWIRDTVVSIERVGVDAIPIVGLISFLLGLIMAFMSSVQLREFGANIYVASLVALAMVRELGPIITAVLVAGRSGSSFAAEIGTMKISDEVDALFTMGLEPTQFLVVPRLVASVIALPILTLLCDLFAIAGGLLVGVVMLDLTLSGYMQQTFEAITSHDILWSLFKAVCFGMLICWISCYRGFRARGGPEAVGRATTSAVVSSIFLIILADSIFAILLTYWG